MVDTAAAPSGDTAPLPALMSDDDVGIAPAANITPTDWSQYQGPNGVPRINVGTPSAPKTQAGATEPSTGTNDKLLTDADLGIKPPDAPPTVAGTLTQVPVGFNESLADTLGAPVDFTTWILNHMLPPTSGASNRGPLPRIEHPFGGSDSIKSLMGIVGANPDQVPAKNSLERIARGVGAGAGAVLGPETVVGLAGKAGPAAAKIADAAKTVFGSSESVPTAISSTTAGAVGGGTGKAAAEAVPEKYKPIADVVGNVVGGGATALTTAAGREGVQAAKTATAPFRVEGQKDLAAAKLQSAATSPKAALDVLENEPTELVPGSKPTTFQATGDTGLGQLERGIATKAPQDFADRRAEQNAARTQALTDVQPTGEPQKVVDLLNQQRKALDDITQLGVDRATANAQKAAQTLGPGMTTEQHGQAISGEIAPKLEARTNEAAQEVRNLGGQGTPEEYGAGLRGSLAERRAFAKEQEDALWNAVDPDKKLVVGMQPVFDRANSIYGEMSPAAATQITGAEADAVRALNAMGDAVHLQELTDLSSNISAALRDEGAGTPAYRRLTMLRQGIEHAINGTVSQKAAQEAAAVQSGAMRPEETMAARLQAQVKAYYAKRAEEARSDLSGGVGATASDDATVFRPGQEAGVVTDGGPRIVPGSQRLGADAELTPNFDQAAKDRLDAARNATRERATTFDTGTTGRVLKRQSATDYKMLPSAVPEKIFHSGNTGGQDVQNYLRTVGNDPDGIAALHNYAAYSLRKAALRPDGTLDPKRFDTWLRTHQEAVNALPPEIGARFADAANASRALERFAPFSASTAPAQVPGMFFHPGPGGATGVRQLELLVGQDTAHKMLSDFAADNLISKATKPDGTIDPGKFETWRKQHSDALDAVPGLKDKLSTAAKATEAIAEAAAQRRDVLENYQRGAIGKMMGVQEPEDVVRNIGSIFGKPDSVAQMKQLAAEAAKDPQAKAGLRKAIVDYMMNKFIGNMEAGTSGLGSFKSDQFQTFMRNNQASLRAAGFTDEEMASMNAIAADLKRANRSNTAVKNPGGSNTAQDTVAAKGASSESGLVGKIGTAVAGSLLGRLVLPVGEVLGAFGGGIANAMRDAGMHKVDDIVREAMLDPELAKVLLKRAPIKEGRGSYITLGQALRRHTMYGAIQGASDQREQ